MDNDVEAVSSPDTLEDIAYKLQSSSTNVQTEVLKSLLGRLEQEGTNKY